MYRGGAAGGETLFSDVCCLVFVISFISRWGEGGLRGGWTFEGGFLRIDMDTLEGCSVIARGHMNE